MIIKARKFVIDGLDYRKAQKRIRNKDKSLMTPEEVESLDVLLSPLIATFNPKEAFSDLGIKSGRVIDGGDNYPHHFSRNEWKDKESKKIVERAFTFDFDRVKFRKRSVALVQLLCSPVLNLSWKEIVSYSKDYYKMFETQREKSVNKKFKQSEKKFVEEIIRFGIYESAFHGPSKGAFHELFNKPSYDHLMTRVRHIDSLEFKYFSKKEPVVLNDFNFQNSLYNNAGFIAGYQRTAGDLAKVILDNKIKNIVNFSDNDRKNIDNLINLLQDKKYDIGDGLKFIAR